MLDALSILQEAYECGILDATEVAIKINMTKENYVKERHPYSISSRKDGRFITTVRKEDEERQQIAAPSLDKEILSVNPLLNTHTSIKFRSIQKKKDGSRLYLEKELEILEDFFYKQETMEAYTILMDFQIGTRIGELVVLKKEDMLDDEVYIHKMEIVDEERVDGEYIRKGYKVVEYVKHDISSGYRTVPLTKKAKKILEEVKKLSPDSEYLFTQANGERMTSRSFNYWLEKYCRDAGITFKSSHCIRRTFASRLYAQGMPLEEISVYMGHEDTDTTKGYIYNYNEIEKNRAYMDKAL